MPFPMAGFLKSASDRFPNAATISHPENSSRIVAVLAPKSGTSPSGKSIPFTTAPGANICISPPEVRTETKRFWGCLANSSISLSRPKAICAACNFAATVSIGSAPNAAFKMASRSVRFVTRFTFELNFGFVGNSGCSKTSLHKRCHSRSFCIDNSNCRPSPH